MTTDIVALQQRDHADLDALLERYVSAGEDKAAVYGDIRELVTTHAFAEETVLFPAARRLLREADAITAGIESKHQRINELMAALEDLTPGSPEFDEKTPELFELLRADVREEEDVLLVSLARDAGERELHTIGAAWAVARRTAPNRPHPEIPRRPPGNALAGLPLAVVDRLRNLVGRR